jgi:parallel beta-helix repeat protein
MTNLRKQNVFLFLFTLILLFSLCGTSFVSSVKANPGPMPTVTLPPPIYIRENGTIEGGNGEIQCNGNNYIFTRNVDRILQIEKKGIVLDGNGFNITKPKIDVDITHNWLWPVYPEWFPSIRIQNVSDILIKNMTFYQCYYGIYIMGSSNVLIFNNTISESSFDGVFIRGCNHCQIIGNKLIENGGGLSIGGSDVNSSYITITYNTFTENSGYGANLSLQNSEISKNNFNNNSLSKYSTGLEFEAYNYNNQVHENNFIGNSYAVIYFGYLTDNFQIYRNFWSNNGKNIVDWPNEGSIQDKSPLSTPIPIIFDAEKIPSHSDPNTANMFAIVIISLVLTSVVTCSGLTIYLRLRNNERRKTVQN